MPCSMYEGVTSGDFAKEDARRAQEQADEAMKAANEVTAILCKVLSSLPPAVVSGMDKDVFDWWQKHKEHDAKHGR